MEKQEKINVSNSETLTKTKNQKQVEEDEEGVDDNFPPEEFPDEFQCCVCLELLYKPVVLACGHMSCFWCVYNAMNHVHESNCPICRCPYNHFPSVCQLLHFLLLKLYPIAYKRRERQVQEEEKRADRFSFQFDQNLAKPKPHENSDILGNNQNPPNLQMDIHSESCSKDWESSSFVDSLKTTMQDEKGMTSKPMTSSKDLLEASANEPNQEKSWTRNEHQQKDQKLSIADLLCAACNKLLLRPVVLNCGHVYCESCFLIPKDEILRCQVCRSLQPNGFPSVCLILEHFLEEQFPEEYAERQRALLKEHNCSIQSQRDASRSASNSTNVYSSWFLGNGPKVHIGVGCDYCGMTPIIGERYKCRDCVEKIGFDLCESCYKDPAKIAGRFNQQHKPEHQFDILEPLSLSDLIFRLTSEQSDDDISDDPIHTEDATHTPMLSAGVQPDQGEDSQESEVVSPSLILSVDVSLDQEDDSDDPNDRGHSPVHS